MKEKIPPLILLDGETYWVEFKEKIANLDREIVAFANGSGGSIFLGVNDQGNIVGVTINNRLKSQITDIARNCDPSIQIELIAYPTEQVLEIKIKEGTDKPYRCKEGFFLRIGPSAQKLKRDEIIQLIHESGKVHFDEALNESFEYPKDFSQEALQGYLTQCGIVTTLPEKDILLNINVAQQQEGKIVFSNAGILFFAKSPQRFHPESYITAVLYQSFDRLSIIDKKDFSGSLIEQIENTMAFCLRHLSVETKITAKTTGSLGTREDIYDYPLVALREAIVNAVTHRDYYYDGSHIYVHIYPDRIDIENPGGLYHGLSIENLGKRSVRRNRLIADLLHRAHYIERVGSGFDRMQQALSENNNPELEVSATNFFNIRFFQRLKKIENTALTPRQTKIYTLIQQHQTLSRKAITVALNLSDDSALRDLNALVKLGLIKKTGTGRATVYRIIPSG